MSATDEPAAEPGARFAAPALPDGPAADRLRVAQVPVPDSLITALEIDLGTDAVRVDERSRAEAGRDWWPLTFAWALQGAVPTHAGVVVRPDDAAGVATVLRLASEARVPVTPAAGRSGVCGGAIPVAGGIALDLTGLDRILDVDDISLRLHVEAGVYGDTLEADLRTRGYTLGHWPQSIAISTVGGWLACRSAGQYSTRYGKIEDMVRALTVVHADGSVAHVGGAGPRTATGPDLTQLFVGSEGALGVITDAVLAVHPAPAYGRFAAYGLPTFAAGLDVIRRVLRRGATPAVVRLLDPLEAIRHDYPGAVLIVLDEGDPVVVDAMMTVVDDVASGAGAQRLGDEIVQSWLGHRNDVSALEAAVRAGWVVDTVELAGTWTVLPDLYHRVVRALEMLPGSIAASAHCSHAYIDGGCLYFTFAYESPANLDAKDRVWRAAFAAVMRAAMDTGSAISHHHGVGINRSAYLPEALGAGAYADLVAIKHALDPNGILNPGALGLPSPFLPDGWSWA
ncbi:MAG: FAD/FMN-dependent dehydrogenase [Actinomycetia bacterium]|nr:FAD/FMN-dependent dehydrogenase [Actinomycetes bacterium]